MTLPRKNPIRKMTLYGIFNARIMLHCHKPHQGKETKGVRFQTAWPEAISRFFQSPACLFPVEAHFLHPATERTALLCGIKIT